MFLYREVDQVVLGVLEIIQLPSHRGSGPVIDLVFVLGFRATLTITCRSWRTGL